MKRTVIALAILLASLMGSLATAAPDRPRIVLVHGAFADSSSWAGCPPGCDHWRRTSGAAAEPRRGPREILADIHDWVRANEDALRATL